MFGYTYYFKLLKLPEIKIAYFKRYSKSFNQLIKTLKWFFSFANNFND